MNTIDEMIEVLQATKEGKAIEYRTLGGDTWKDSGTYAPNFASVAYRVKKVQRRRWCVDYTYGSGSAPFTAVFVTEEAAERWTVLMGFDLVASKPYEVAEVVT